MAADPHANVAPYALDALDADEEREFEEHLASCEACREELASLREATAALAYGAVGPAPPPELKERILAEANIEVGGVEYLIDARDGRPYFYDINALSNFVADPVNVLGFDPWRSLVDYLLERAGVPKQDALKPESTIRRAARETAAALASAVISAPALP